MQTSLDHMVGSAGSWSRRISKHDNGALRCLIVDKHSRNRVKRILCEDGVCGRLLLIVARHGLCNKSEDSFNDENTEPARVPKLVGGKLMPCEPVLGTKRNVFSRCLESLAIGLCKRVTSTKPIPAAP